MLNLYFLKSNKVKEIFLWETIGLHHSLDGVNNPMYKLLRFIHLTIFFAKRRGH
jgi:hypothetical protein